MYKRSILYYNHIMKNFDETYSAEGKSGYAGALPETKTAARVNPGPIRRSTLAVMIAAVLLAGYWGCDSDKSGNTGENADFSGLVDIGNGRGIYLECIGTGSPTVVLISGGFEAGWIWKYALYSTDLVLDAPTDEFSASRGDIQKLGRAVFPTSGKLTRVCNYDRSNTTLGSDIEGERGGLASTPVEQPHTVEQDVADLHALLAAAKVPGPYILVAHSYGGFITELYARTYPGEVAGRVLVDVTTAFLKNTLTEEELNELGESTMMLNPANPGAERLMVLDAMDSIINAPAPPRVPVFLLSADKPGNSNPETLHLLRQIRLAHDMLAAELCAKHMKRTNSGHHIFAEQPQLVNDAIREVVEAAGNGCTSIPCEGVPPGTDPSIALPDCAPAP